MPGKFGDCWHKQSRDFCQCIYTVFKKHGVKFLAALARERMGKLDPLWRSRAISPPLKACLIQTLVRPIVTYGAEAWTLSKDLRSNIEAFELQCYRRSMKISYRDQSCHEWNGAGQSRPEKEITTTGEESQTEIVRPRFTSHISRKRYHAGHYARHQKTGRSTERKVRWPCAMDWQDNTGLGREGRGPTGISKVRLWGCRHSRIRYGTLIEWHWPSQATWVHWWAWIPDALLPCLHLHVSAARWQAARSLRPDIRSQNPEKRARWLDNIVNIISKLR